MERRVEVALRTVHHVEFHDQEFGDVVLLVGLVHALLANGLVHRRVEQFLFDVRCGP